ncbi:MAG TPA: hypothetical protein ENN63_10515 [Bacteroidetes bacterium]|nr:hypothetical protein [Bacteroidota bacterium]
MPSFTSRKALIAAFLFLGLFLLLPTNNPGIDAWYYAASVKYQGELFHPHHLLYNATCYLVARLFSIAGATPGTLSLMNALNAFIAFLILLVMIRIIRMLSDSADMDLAGVVFTGSCFALMRYATESETYLFPLLLGLMASMFFLHYRHSGRIRDVVLSGLLASLGVLYHQTGIFWWMGLLALTLFNSGKKKAALGYAATGLIIPLVYLGVWFSMNGLTGIKPLTGFIFRSYLEGDASLSADITGFLLGLAGLVRSFLQVHGNMWLLFRHSLWYLFPALLAVAVWSVLLLRRPWNRITRKHGQERFATVHLSISVALWIFAVLSSGNVEFMVAIPALLFISSIAVFRFSVHTVLLTGTGLLIWNTGYGLIPARLYRYEPVRELAARVAEHPGDLFILKEDQRIQAAYYYLTGKETAPGIFRPPSDLPRRGITAGSLHRRIEQTLERGGNVWTDCLERPVVLNRATLVSGQDTTFFSRYLTVPSDTLHTFYGNTIIHRVDLKNGQSKGFSSLPLPDSPR